MAKSTRDLGDSSGSNLSDSGIEVTIPAEERGSTPATRPNDSADGVSESEERPLPFERLGEFRLIEELGHGGMGVVYRAKEIDLDREVALKILPKTKSHRRGMIERFELEAKAAASLNHDHIVPVYHVGVDHGTRYFAMKLIRGSTLSQIVKSARLAVKASKETRVQPSATTRRDSDMARGQSNSKDVPRLSEVSFVSSVSTGDTKSFLRLTRSVALAGMQIADALQHAHDRGVIHRDVKPSNLMVDKDNKVWVTDFGLAQLRQSPSLTNTGDIVGTLQYMSPEQASGRRAFLDNRTDIYSLGVTLYELITLRSACRGRTVEEILREIMFERPVPLRKVHPDVPKDLETIIGKAMERNPDDRYESAQAMADDLRRFAEGKRIDTKRISPWKRTRDWLYKHPKSSAGVFSAVLALLIGTFLYSLVLSSDITAVREEKREYEKMYSELQTEKLVVEAQLQASSDPGLAASLIAAAKGAPEHLVNPIVHGILANLHEEMKVTLPFPEEGMVAVSRGLKPVAIKCSGAVGWGKRRPALVFDLTDGKELGRLQGARTITSVAIHPTMPFVLTAGSNHRRRGAAQSEVEFAPVEFWNREDFSRKSVHDDLHSTEVSPQSFSLVDNRVVLPQGDSFANFVDLQSMRMVGPRLEGHAGKVLQAVFSPDGQTVATWSRDKTVRLWDSSSGEELRAFPCEVGDVHAVRLEFSPDSGHLLARGSGIFVFDCNSEESGQLRLTGALAVFGSKGKELFVVPQYGSSIVKADLSTGKRSTIFDAKSGILDLSLSNDGRYLAAAAYDQLQFIDLLSVSSRGAVASSVGIGHQSWISTVDSIPNTSKFCTTGVDGTLRVWNTFSDAELRTIRPNLGGFSNHVALSPSGSSALLSTTTRHQTKVWNVEQILNAGAQSPKSVIGGNCKAVLPDGRFITVDAGRVTLWSNRNSIEEEFVFNSGETPSEMVVIPNNEGLLYSTNTSSLVYWELKSGRRQFLELRESDSQSVSAETYVLKPDGQNRCVWLSLNDYQLGKWDASKRELQVVHQFSSRITAIGVAADGSRLALGFADGKVVSWDVANSNVLKSRQLADGRVSFVEFLDTAGDRIVFSHQATPNTSEVRIWEVASDSDVGKCIFQELTDVKTDAKLGIAVCVDRLSGLFLWNSGEASWQSLTESSVVAAELVQNHVVFATDTGVSEYPVIASAPQVEIEEAQLNVWDVENSELKAQIPIPVRAEELRFSDIGRIYLSGTAHGAMFWGLDSDRVLDCTTHSSSLVLAEFLSEEQCLTLAKDGGVALHSISPDGSTQVADDAKRLPHRYTVASAALSADSKFLVSTDVTGKTLRTEIASWESKEVELGFESHCNHVCMPDNVTVLSFNGSSRVVSWDLRSLKVVEFDFDGGVFEIELASNGKKALLSVGPKRPFAIPSRTFPAPKAKPKDSPDAWLLDWTNVKVGEEAIRNAIYTEGDVLDATFLPSGDRIALLNTAGQIEIRSLQAPDRTDVSLTAQRRMQFLLDGRSSSYIFGACQDRLWGFDCESGQVVWDIPATFDTAMFFVPNPNSPAESDWSVSGDDKGWHLVPSRDGYEKIPADLVEYLSNKNLRELTEVERLRYAGPTISKSSN